MHHFMLICKNKQNKSQTTCLAYKKCHNHHVSVHFSEYIDQSNLEFPFCLCKIHRTHPLPGEDWIVNYATEYRVRIT